MTKPDNITLTEYSDRRALQLFRWASYVGGEEYRYPRPSTMSSQSLRFRTLDSEGKSTLQEARRTSFLVPFDSESDAAYDKRLALSAYINVVAPIVESYARGTTAGVVRNLGPLTEYAEDVDTQGTSWEQFVESIALWLAVYGELAIVTDAPDEDPAASKAGDRRAPYCVLVHPTAWAWTKQDSRGKVVEFAYVEQALQDPGSTQTSFRLRVLTTMGWKIVRKVVSVGSSVVSADGELVGEGEWPAQLGGKLPVVFAFFKRDQTSLAPRGISLVGDVCDIARTIYNRRSSADTIALEAGFPTLTIPSGDTGGQLDTQTRIQIGTSKALGYNAQAGSPQWLQPSSEWFREIHRLNVEDFRLCLRLTGVDSDGDAGAASSGEALRIRSRDFESQARSFARNLRGAERSVLRLLAAWAGVPDADIDVQYPTRFVLPDRRDDYERALGLLKDSPVELGVTAKLVAARQMVNAAVTLDEEESRKVNDELEALLNADAERYAREMAPPDRPQDKQGGEGDAAQADPGQPTGTPPEPRGQLQPRGPGDQRGKPEQAGQPPRAG